MAVRLFAELATKVGNGAAESAGRWRLNSGSEMVVTVPGLGGSTEDNPKPVRLVVDLSSARPKAPRIVALNEHNRESTVGFWDKIEVNATDGIYADLSFVKPADEREALVLADAVRLAAVTRAGVPLQASVGIDAGDGGKWDLVPGGQAVTVNGKQFSGDGDMPLYVLRGGVFDETSVCTFGADSDTGRVAASKSKSHEGIRMDAKPTLKALLAKFPEKHHGLIARCYAEEADEADIKDKVNAAEMDERDAKIKELEAKCASLQAQVDQQGIKAEADDYAAGDAEKKEESDAAKKVAASTSATSTKAVRFGATDAREKKADAAQPKTLTEAMNHLRAQGSKNTGFALRKEARAKFPDAKEA